MLTRLSAHAGVLQSPGRGKPQGKGPPVYVTINKHLTAASSLEVALLCSALRGSGGKALALDSDAFIIQICFIRTDKHCEASSLLCVLWPACLSTLCCPKELTVVFISHYITPICSSIAGSAGDRGQRTAPFRRYKHFYGSEPHVKIMRPGSWARKRRPAPCICAAEDRGQCATGYPLLMASLECPPLRHYACTCSSCRHAALKLA